MCQVSRFHVLILVVTHIYILILYVIELVYILYIYTIIIHLFLSSISSRLVRESSSYINIYIYMQRGNIQVGETSSSHNICNMYILKVDYIYIYNVSVPSFPKTKITHKKLTVFALSGTGIPVSPTPWALIEVTATSKLMWIFSDARYFQPAVPWTFGKVENTLPGLTNMTSWKITIFFHRKYIFNQRVHFQAIYVIVGRRVDCDC